EAPVLCCAYREMPLLWECMPCRRPGAYSRRRTGTATKGPFMKPTPKQRIWMYEGMWKSRRFDDAVFQAYWEGKKPVFHMGKGPLPGEMHQSFGQEPAAVGVIAHLGPDDAVGAGHRPHHVAIARGVNLK